LSETCGKIKKEYSKINKYRMKKVLLFSLIAILGTLGFSANAQDTEEVADSTKLWTKSGSVGLIFSNVGLENWTGGGVSSISLGLVSNFKVVRETDVSVWDNQIDFAYGGIKQDGNETFRKTDDQLIISSQYGYKISKKWSLSASANFRTQVAPAYTYKTDSVGNEIRNPRTTNFMAPGYLNSNIGLTYKTNKSFTATISPIANKTTFVLDKGVDETGFGLDEGDKVRAEFGYSLVSNYTKEVMKNVNFTTNLVLFADYENPTEIDVNWETLLAMKVNKYITTSFGTQLIYDEDVLITDENGKTSNSKIQFKHVLNIGIGITF
jgi:hypothetical protein